jgi:hypothetical protein
MTTQPGTADKRQAMKLMVFNLVSALFSDLQGKDVPDEVIAEEFLRQIATSIEYNDDPAFVAALLPIINWFSGECRDLIQEPQIGKQGHTAQHWN